MIPSPTKPYASPLAAMDNARDEERCNREAGAGPRSTKDSARGSISKYVATRRTLVRRRARRMVVAGRAEQGAAN